VEGTTDIDAALSGIEALEIDIAVNEAEPSDIDSAVSESEALHPLLTAAVPIDNQCIGDRWSAQDEAQLARLIAIIAMGQAAYAAHILKELLPASPAFTTEDLKREATVRLSVEDGKKTPRTGYPRWQRDGFIFEAISWIAARQTYGERALLIDPHISSTSQGLDNLMIELSPDRAKIIRTTVFEDKCTDNPRKTFLEKVIPAFLERHQNKRSAELVAAAAVLLRTDGIDDAAAARLAAAVMNIERRRYRAAFALTKDHDCQDERQGLFKGYDALENISADQRVAASFIVPGELRGWFDQLALRAISFLEDLEEDEV
jgi:hypothetical protein